MRGVTNELFKDNEDSFFIPQEDYEGMAEKILLLLNDEKLRLSMGNSAYSKTKELSIDMIGKKWINIIENVLREVKNTY